MYVREYVRVCGVCVCVCVCVCDTACGGHYLCERARAACVRACVITNLRKLLIYVHLWCVCVRLNMRAHNSMYMRVYINMHNKCRTNKITN